jgi:hypothetical protein
MFPYLCHVYFVLCLFERRFSNYMFHMALEGKIIFKTYHEDMNLLIW